MTIFIEDLAVAKNLPVQFLADNGVSPSTTGIVIDYGPDARRRHRDRRGFTWLGGSEAPIIVYGTRHQRNMELARYVGYVIIVEGESDTWTLWHNDLPAIGVPGSSMVGKLTAADLIGLETLYVVREPDEAGSKFVAAVEEHVRSLGWAIIDETMRAGLATDTFLVKTPTVLELQMPSGFKDPSDLWVNHDAFTATMDDLLRDARERGPTRTQASAGGVVDGATFALDESDEVIPIWGDGDEVLWATGEPLLIFGNDGTGKTTLALRLVLAMIGVDDEETLGYSVQRTEKGVLYFAADRPKQVLRSLRRMVSESDRERLAQQLTVSKGPLDFDIAKDPQKLVEMAHHYDCDRVILDSLKDVAIGLNDDEVGAGVNSAFQRCVSAGVEVLILHHPRKAQVGNKRPTSLDDVYGSRWIRSGCGSVLIIDASPGDPIVRLLHRKMPLVEVGPLEVLIDGPTGAMTVTGSADLPSILAAASGGLTVKHAAALLYRKKETKVTRPEVEKARRKLDKLVDDGAATMKKADMRTAEVTYYPS